MRLQQITQKWPTKWTEIAAVLCMLAVIAYAVHPIIGNLPRYRHGSLNRGDVDSPAILAGLARAVHSRHYVFSWFYGAWVCHNKFFRPIPSLLWLAMYKAWGPNSLEQFEVVIIISHVFAMLVMFGFFRRLVGVNLSAIAVSVFALNVPDWLGLPGSAAAVGFWINLVDLWVSPAILGTAWLFDKYLENRKNQCLYASLVMCLLSIGIKEMSYVIPLLLTWLLVVRNRLTQDWKLVVPFVIECAVLLLYRTAIFHGRGAVYGSNGSWLLRLVTFMFGGDFVLRMTHDCLDDLLIFTFIVTIALWVNAYSKRTKIVLLSATAATIALGATYLADGALLGFDASDNILRFFSGSNVSLVPEVYYTVIPSLAIVLLWYSGFRWHLKGQIIGYSFAWVMYVPILSAAITGHALYHACMGFSLVIAATLQQLWIVAASKLGTIYSKQTIWFRSAVKTNDLST